MSKYDKHVWKHLQSCMFHNHKAMSFRITNKKMRTIYLMNHVFGQLFVFFLVELFRTSWCSSVPVMWISETFKVWAMHQEHVKLNMSRQPSRSWQWRSVFVCLIHLFHHCYGWENCSNEIVSALHITHNSLGLQASSCWS